MEKFLQRKVEKLGGGNLKVTFQRWVKRSVFAAPVTMLRVGQKVLLRAVDSVKGPTKAIKPSRGQKSGLLTSHKFLKAQIQRRHYQKAVEAAKEMAKVFWQGGKEL